MKTIGQNQKRQSYALLKRQAIFVLVICTIIFAFFGFRNASAALVGGLISVSANAICIYRMFRPQGVNIQRALGQFYTAELMKIISTVIMLVVCFKFTHVNYLYLLVGYAAAQSSFWFLPVFSRSLRNIGMREVNTDAGQLS